MTDRLALVFKNALAKWFQYEPKKCMPCRPGIYKIFSGNSFDIIDTNNPTKVDIRDLQSVLQDYAVEKSWFLLIKHLPELNAWHVACSPKIDLQVEASDEELIAALLMCHSKALDSVYLKTLK